MIRFVPFSMIALPQLRAVALSLMVAPPDVRLSEKDLIDGLMTGLYRMFEWDDGLLVVHEEDNRLIIDAMSASIWKRKDLAADLKRLAADWLCDTVQTTVFDKRLADAIVNIGGSIESYDVVLNVGTDNEQ